MRSRNKSIAHLAHRVAGLERFHRSPRGRRRLLRRRQSRSTPRCRRRDQASVTMSARMLYAVAGRRVSSLPARGLDRCEQHGVLGIRLQDVEQRVTLERERRRLRRVVKAGTTLQSASYGSTKSWFPAKKPGTGTAGPATPAVRASAAPRSFSAKLNSSRPRSVHGVRLPLNEVFTCRKSPAGIVVTSNRVATDAPRGVNGAVAKNANRQRPTACGPKRLRAWLTH